MTKRAPGRPSGRQSDKTRTTILDSARYLLAQNGFDRTTVRAVATRAQVDPALVHHYFGTKANLIGEAMRPPIDFAAVFADMPTDSTAGPEFVRRAITVWESPEVHAHAVGVVRILLGSAEVAALAPDVAADIVGPALRGAVCDDRPERRLALVASHMFGLLMLRFVVGQPDLKAATADELAAQIGPTITHYLTGELD